MVLITSSALTNLGITNVTWNVGSNYTGNRKEYKVLLYLKKVVLLGHASIH